jgi:hypothetical protein
MNSISRGARRLTRTVSAPHPIAGHHMTSPSHIDARQLRWALNNQPALQSAGTPSGCMSWTAACYGRASNGCGLFITLGIASSVPAGLPMAIRLGRFDPG